MKNLNSDGEVGWLSTRINFDVYPYREERHVQHTSSCRSINVGRMYKLMLQAGIHGVPQTIADIVERQNADKDDQTWIENLGGLGPHIILVFGEHIAPGGHRRLDAETQERER